MGVLYYYYSEERKIYVILLPATSYLLLPLLLCIYLSRGSWWKAASRCALCRLRWRYRGETGRVSIAFKNHDTMQVALRCGWLSHCDSVGASVLRWLQQGTDFPLRTRGVHRLSTIFPSSFRSSFADWCFDIRRKMALFIFIFHVERYHNTQYCRSNRVFVR